jgi:hypothetical protein
MSYKPRDLSVIGYCNGFTLWHLQSTDDPAAIAAPDYFSDAANLLQPGDFILARMSGSRRSGGENPHPCFGVLVVLQIKPGVATTQLTTPVGMAPDFPIDHPAISAAIAATLDPRPHDLRP